MGSASSAWCSSTSTGHTPIGRRIRAAKASRPPSLHPHAGGRSAGRLGTRRRRSKGRGPRLRRWGALPAQSVAPHGGVGRRAGLLRHGRRRPDEAGPAGPAGLHGSTSDSDERCARSAVWLLSACGGATCGAFLQFPTDHSLPTTEPSAVSGVGADDGGPRRSPGRDRAAPLDVPQA
eukprot:3568917-Prymnesium_polylepis.1